MVSVLGTASHGHKWGLLGRVHLYLVPGLGLRESRWLGLEGGRGGLEAPGGSLRPPPTQACPPPQRPPLAQQLQPQQSTAAVASLPLLSWPLLQGAAWESLQVASWPGQGLAVPVACQDTLLYSRRAKARGRVRGLGCAAGLRGGRCQRPVVWVRVRVCVRLPGWSPTPAARQPGPGP